MKNAVTTGAKRTRWHHVILVIAMFASVLVAPNLASASPSFARSVIPAVYDFGPTAGVGITMRPAGTNPISNPQGTRFLDAGNSSQSWSVSHAGPQSGMDQQWGVISAGNFLQMIDAPCERARPEDLTSMCKEDTALLEAAQSVGAIDVVAVYTDAYATSARWLDVAGTSNVRTIAGGRANRSVWFVVPADAPGLGYLVSAATGRYLSRSGGPGNITTVPAKGPASIWELPYLSYDRYSEETHPRSQRTFDLFSRETPLALSGSKEGNGPLLEMSGPSESWNVEVGDGGLWAALPYSEMASRADIPCTADMTETVHCAEDLPVVERIDEVGAVAAIGLSTNWLDSPRYLQGQFANNSFNVRAFVNPNVTSQLWYVIPTESDQYVLLNAATNRYLTVDANGNAATAAVHLSQATELHGLSQLLPAVMPHHGGSWYMFR